MSKVAYLVKGPHRLRHVVAAAMLAFALIVLAAHGVSAQTAQPTTSGSDVRTEAQGGLSKSDIWSAIRKGEMGDVSIPDRKAGRLIQSEGETWRAVHNGPLTVYGAYALLGTVVFLAIFFILRGRVRIDHGWSGVTIERFNTLERFGHWLMAGSFIILALTGLNLLFGRHVLLPLIGKPAFAALAMWGKYAHNYVAFAFMAGVALVFVMWVAHNLPAPGDIKWLVRGGGLFTPGSHPPSRKFNAGQKLIFWLVVLGTVSSSLSGIALLFPFETHFMAKTFVLLNSFGAGLPTDLTPLAEQQIEQVWHAIVAIGFTCVILAHIYIGSVGMEGAFAAMGSGQVDLNWAREHHDLWVAETEAKAAEATGQDAAGAQAQPAE
jgi:formate dehydrogenase subunit gamma